MNFNLPRQERVRLRLLKVTTTKESESKMNIPRQQRGCEALKVKLTQTRESESEVIELRR